MRSKDKRLEEIREAKAALEAEAKAAAEDKKRGGGSGGGGGGADDPKPKA